MPLNKENTGHGRIKWTNQMDKIEKEEKANTSGPINRRRAVSLSIQLSGSAALASFLTPEPLFFSAPTPFLPRSQRHISRSPHIRLFISVPLITLIKLPRILLIHLIIPYTWMMVGLSPEPQSSRFTELIFAGPDLQIRTLI